MDTLVAIGTGTAYLFSAVSTLAGALLPLLEDNNMAANYLSHGNNLYYETAAVITSLILVGRYLEKRATTQANQAIYGKLLCGSAYYHLL